MPLDFNPPLLNSANPWASTCEQLKELYNCPHTGAVTIRTSLLHGFKHDDAIHQCTFFDARTNTPMQERSPNANSTLNTLGYSPTPLAEYLQMTERIATARSNGAHKKPFIVSVTGTAEEVVECHRLITTHAKTTAIPMLMEVNLSCPNITDRPPPAYDTPALHAYLLALQHAPTTAAGRAAPLVPVGIKTPPFTYHGQFAAVVDALLATTRGGARCPVDFITATNTLGGCMVMVEADAPSRYVPAVKGGGDTGIGGLGGAAIHALSLGNVATLRKMLDQHSALSKIDIIGVGGVADSMGYGRMRSAGAAVVAVGTALGKQGIDVFQKISIELRVAEDMLRRSSSST